MKNKFFGFYSPTDKEFSDLWSNSIFVLDTNVLLNLYKLPKFASDELFDLLNRLNDRIWIPHQVALEFQRNRTTVISSEKKKIQDILSESDKFLISLRKNIDDLQIPKRGIDVDVEPIFESLDLLKEKISSSISKIQDNQLELGSSDPVRTKIDNLLDGRVGEGPVNQNDLDNLTQDGEDRYAEKIPPGYLDVSKDNPANQSTFIFDGIKYQRKFGDLILWKQLLSYSKENSIKNVIFVTGDSKEDWWLIEKGKTIGPQPELIREIRRFSNVDNFWMYNYQNFVVHANKYFNGNISAKTVDEIVHVAEEDKNDSINNQNLKINYKNTRGSVNIKSRLWDMMDSLNFLKVSKWIDQNYGFNAEGASESSLRIKYYLHDNKLLRIYIVKSFEEASEFHDHGYFDSINDYFSNKLNIELNNSVQFNVVIHGKEDDIKNNIDGILNMKFIDYIMDYWDLSEIRVEYGFFDKDKFINI
ncbi:MULTISPECIES: PIN domain-containing protein [Comamonas]|uniref:PIN domain-containing protein n=1 Tax=Comamonas TaxID=283 RepID=UPI00257C7238|nr:MULTISPECIES: PIN domain-containing protein [Comamonas]